MGEVLIAGMAAMLICIFLGPKFIEYLRVKEFGQHIREDGPQEHHAKAGTPTMGGLIIFASICVPYLVLSDRDAQSMAVFGVAMGCAAIGFADDFIKIVKRRSLGLSARWKMLAAALPRARRSGGSPATRSASNRSSTSASATPRSTSARSSTSSSSSSSSAAPPTGSTSPTASTASPPAPARSSCSPTRRSPSSPTSSRTSPCSRPAWSAPASDSSGTTPSRPRYSWATPAHSDWGAQSAPSR